MLPWHKLCQVFFSVSIMLLLLALCQAPCYTFFMPKPRKNPVKFDTAIIGKTLQVYRKKRGLTQNELAEKIGVTRQAVTAYETGRGRILDTTLISLAHTLNVSTDILLGIKMAKSEVPVSRRLMKRITVVDTFSEPTKKYIIKFLDATIRASKLT